MAAQAARPVQVRGDLNYAAYPPAGPPPQVQGAPSPPKPHPPAHPRPPSATPYTFDNAENSDYVRQLKNLKPFLGMTVSNPRNKGGTGVLVVAIVPDSPAALSGLRQGDSISKLNGKTISDHCQFKGCCAALHTGDIALIQYIRSRQALETVLTVGAAQDGTHNLTADQVMKLARYARRQRPERTLYSLQPSIGMSFSDTGDHSGIRISGVFPGDAADVAGIRRGDILVQMDGVPIKTQADFWGIYNASMPGDLISTQIKREKKYYKVSLVVGAKGIAMDEVKRLTLSKREQVDVLLENKLDALQKSIGVGFTDDRKPGSAGVIVCKVKPGHSGERAGLKVGDVIVKMNGVVLRNKDYFWGAYYAARPGDVVPLTIVRHIPAKKLDLELDLILLIGGKTDKGDPVSPGDLERLASASRLTESIRSLYSMIPSLGMSFELATREGDGVFGLHVLAVQPSSACDHAGILPKDVITSIGGMPITSRSHFHGYFSMLRAGDVSPVVLQRQNSVQRVYLMVGAKGESPEYPGHSMLEIQALVAASLNYEENHNGARQRSASTPRNAQPKSNQDIHNMTPSGGMSLVMEERGRGLQVTTVVAGEAAQYAGISIGDIVYKFMQTPIRSQEEFLEVWRRVAVGDLVPVEILRALDQKPVRLNFMVGAKEIPFAQIIRIKHGELSRELQL